MLYGQSNRRLAWLCIRSVHRYANQRSLTQQVQYGLLPSGLMASMTDVTTRNSSTKPRKPTNDVTGVEQLGSWGMVRSETLW